MTARIVNIFVAPKGGAEMTQQASVDAIAGRGLDGDRYCAHEGHWKGEDECQVTFIEKEALDEIERAGQVSVSDGEHRRNIVTEGLDLSSLSGTRFRIGAAVFEFDKPRPPCGYIAALTSRKMTKALWGRSGICARVIESGRISVDDDVIVETAD